MSHINSGHRVLHPPQPLYGQTRFKYLTKSRKIYKNKIFACLIRTEIRFPKHRQTAVFISYNLLAKTSRIKSLRFINEKITV